MGCRAGADTSGRSTCWSIDLPADREVAERVVGSGVDAPTARGDHLTVLELVRGDATPRVRYLRVASTLAEVLHRATEARDRRAALPLFARLCETLGRAHECGVHHGALRPASVAVVDGGTVVIRGWELATFVDHPDREADRFSVYLQPLRDAADVRSVDGGVDVLACLAPEILRGDAAEPDTASDVYALGAILHQLLTGHAPHSFQTADELLAKVEGSGPQPATDLADDVPPALSDLARHCLARNPSDRPGDADEVAERVRAWQDLEGRLDELRSAVEGARAYGGDAAGERLDAAVAEVRALLERSPGDEATAAVLAEAEARRDELLRTRLEAEAKLLAAQKRAGKARGELERVQAEQEHERAEHGRASARREAAVHAAVRAERSRGRRRLVVLSFCSAVAVVAALLLARSCGG